MLKVMKKEEKDVMEKTSRMRGWWTTKRTLSWCNNHDDDDGNDDDGDGYCKT